MSAFAITYFYAGDVEARQVVRPGHIDFLSALHQAGTLLMSGPLEDGDAGALLIVTGVSADEVVGLMDEDPFWRAGLVARREVQRWNVVFGVEALVGKSSRGSRAT